MSNSAQSHRIPSLDGLRALSILAVLIGHLHGTQGAPDWIGTLAVVGPVDVANFGVRIFFVISGLLITSLLIAELERTNEVNLTRFYLRRSIRIFPAYFAFIAVVYLGKRAGVFAATPADFMHALTYTTNYQVDRSWDLGHLWSLSLEEQFYLVWPVTLGALGLRRARPLLFTVVLLVPLLRVVLSTVSPSYRPLIGASFETGIDAIALGCLLALERDRLWTRQDWRRLVTSRLLVLVLFSLAVVASLRYRSALLVGIPLGNLAILFLVERCVRLPGGWFGRLLNSRALVYVGTLSYSIYLTQQLFLNRNSLQPFAKTPANLVFAAIAALASFYVVESPLLRLRPRLERLVFRSV